METETDKQLSFIDIFISNVNNSFSENYKCFSENYIYIGLLLNYTSIIVLLLVSTRFDSSNASLTGKIK